MESSTLELVFCCGVLAAYALYVILFSDNSGHDAYFQKIEQTLRALAETVGGQYVEVRKCPETQVIRNGLNVRVSIGNDSGPSDGVYTTISIALPPGRAWRAPGLRYRRTPPADIDLTSPATFERYFAGARARELTEDLRSRLLQLAQNDCLVQLYDREMLMFASVPDPSTGRRTFLTDTQRLQGMIDAGTRLAADLLAG